MCFDADGYLLVGGYRSGKIHVFPPGGGERVKTLEVEDPHVTNLCFGGPDFNTLYITESHDGRVVSLPWERSGMVLFPDRVA
jgi:gluconolactonase